MNVEQSSVRYWKIRQIYVGRLRLFCATLILQGWKEGSRNIVKYSDSIRGGNTLSFTHANLCTLCSAGGEKRNFIFRQREPIRSFPLLVCMCGCVPECVSASPGKAESATPKLICYKRETVTGTSGHTVKVVKIFKASGLSLHRRGLQAAPDNESEAAK